jgi:chromate reductase
MAGLRILTIPGSLRKESYNRKLLKLAEIVLVASGAEVDPLDLKDFPFPLFNGDDEAAGLPDNVKAVKTRIAAADGILIASPEYNYTIPGPLKNFIDWTSRQGNPWSGRVVGMLGASNGPIGTWRMMPHLRASLSGLKAIVIPDQINVREAGKVWNDAGELIDEKLPAMVEKMVTEFLRITAALKR